MTTFERVGFIGLGGMGRGLVKNLAAKGVAVTAYDLNPAAVAVANSFGATAAKSVQEIRDSCRIITSSACFRTGSSRMRFKTSDAKA